MRARRMPAVTLALAWLWLAAIMTATTPGSTVAVGVESASPSPDPSASPSPSPAPTGPSALTIAVAPAVAVWGTPFTVRATLTCFGTRVPGAPVEVQRRPASTQPFARIASGTTDADGTFTFVHVPASSGDYRALVPSGTGACGVSTSGLARADVRVGIGSNVPRLSAPRGTPLVIDGFVAPGHPGRRVYLQVLQGSTGAWGNGPGGALTARSTYRLSYRKTSPGMLIVRVVFPTQDGDHAWNVGRNLRLIWT